MPLISFIFKLRILEKIMSDLIWKKHNEFLKTWRLYKDRRGANIEREGEEKWSLLNNDLVAASSQIRDWNQAIEDRKRKASITNFFSVRLSFSFYNLLKWNISIILKEIFRRKQILMAEFSRSHLPLHRNLISSK